MFIAANGVENERDKHLYSMCAYTHVYKNIEKRWRRDERNLCSAVTLLSTINMFSYYNKQNK